MHSFLKGTLDDIKSLTWRQFGCVAIVIFVVYGMMLFNPSTAYDFNAAKGDTLQVFLTYFFMHRIVQASVAGLFHDFTPFWTVSIGLLFLILTGLLLVVLFRRLGFKMGYSLLGVALWVSTPFFFNRSIYQHAFPSETIAFCCDVLAMLGFLELRRKLILDKRLLFVVVLLCAISASVYQAHVNLILTGFMGVAVLDRKNRCRTILKEWVLMAAILGCSLLVWFVVNHGPMLVARLLGIVIPKSGGAHDTIYWLTGEHSLIVNLKALIVGFILNWGYNAFFVIGLRCILLAIFLCLCVCVYWGVRRKWYCAFAVLGLVLSCFVLPVIQCSFANLRTFYCFIPLVSFTGMLFLKLPWKRPYIVIGMIAICIFGMAHETATLYYYNWKVKEHDKLHMSIVAHDLWSKYGLRIDKPVAIIGGWKYYPTCWEDLRPFRQLPLINHPFTTYSNMTCANVSREFYMVAREKIGLLVPMPDLQTYAKLRADKKLLEAPAYPNAGYIFEHDGVIVVNLGVAGSQWGSFRYRDYVSPNEELLERTIGLRRFDQFLIGATSWFRKLAEDYPWTLVLEPEGLNRK